MAQSIKIDSSQVSPLSLAFLGDSVYETAIRAKVLEECKGSLKELNNQSGRYTCAKAQSAIIMTLEKELTEAEISVYKRGRNAKSVSAPKSCSISEYRHATGFEALIGSLYLDENYERIDELADKAISIIKEKYNE